MATTDFIAEAHGTVSLLFASLRRFLSHAEYRAFQPKQRPLMAPNGIQKLTLDRSPGTAKEKTVFNMGQKAH
jgi:hypothetical protein